jgi:hypothetical protein
LFRIHQGIAYRCALGNDDVSFAGAKKLHVHRVSLEHKADDAICRVLCDCAALLTDEHREVIERVPSGTMYIRSFQDGTVGSVDTCRDENLLGIKKKAKRQDVLFLREYLQHL